MKIVVPEVTKPQFKPFDIRIESEIEAKNLMTIALRSQHCINTGMMFANLINAELVAQKS